MSCLAVLATQTGRTSNAYVWQNPYLVVERLGCQRVESPVWRRLYAVEVTESRGARCHCHTKLRFVDLTIPVWLSRKPTVRCFLYRLSFRVSGRATTLNAGRCRHAGRGQNATQILPSSNCSTVEPRVFIVGTANGTGATEYHFRQWDAFRQTACLP